MGKKVSFITPALDWFNAHNKLLDKIAAALLALCPLLQHYIGIVDNAATTVLFLVAAYLVLRVLANWNRLSFAALRPVLFLAGYYVFKLVDHGTSVKEVGQTLLFIGFLVSFAVDCIDTSFLLKVAKWIAVAASGVILLQYFCFYIFGFHLQAVPTGLLLEESKIWELGAQTGLAGITGKIGSLYRPSAFFLEPSHLYLYVFPQLFILLFGNKDKHALYCAMIISFGLVLCTSGMGIAATAGAWVLYFALYDRKSGAFSLKNIVKMRNLILLGIFAALFVVAVTFIPPLKRAVTRIFATAISGRVSEALKRIGNMNPHQWIIGVADTVNANYNMPGLLATLYKYGVVGVILSSWVYLRGLVKQDLPYFLVSAVILVTSAFSAHTHGTFYMLFYVLILLHGERQTDKSLAQPVLDFSKQIIGKIRRK